MNTEDSILYARDAELSILGCAFQGIEAAEEVLAEVPISIVGSHDIQESLMVLREMVDARKPCDAVTFATEYRKKYDRPASLEMVSRASELAFSTANLTYWRDEIREAASRRRLRNAAITLQARATDASKTPEEALGELEATLDTTEAKSAVVESSREVCRRFLDEFEARMQRQGQLSGVPTGFRKLDEMLDGYQFRELTLVGARPSIGKTAFAASIVDAACLNAQVPTLFVTLEMSSAKLMRRIFSTSGNVNASVLRKGTPTEADTRRMSGFLPKISSAPLHFLHLPGYTPHPIITSAAHRLIRKHGVKLVIIDYMQLVGAVGKHEKRTYEVGSASTALKSFAHASGVALVVLAQLNREGEKDNDGAPKLSNLGDSKQLEQDADCVILLHRDRNEKAGPAKLFVVKQRDGETGMVNCSFRGEYVRFEDTETQIGPED